MFLQVAAIYSGLDFQSISGNVELIQILNRLGHGMSYSQLEEVDTARCLKKLAMMASLSQATYTQVQILSSPLTILIGSKEPCPEDGHRIVLMVSPFSLLLTALIRK